MTTSRSTFRLGNDSSLSRTCWDGGRRLRTIGGSAPLCCSRCGVFITHRAPPLVLAALCPSCNGNAPDA